MRAAAVQYTGQDRPRSTAKGRAPTCCKQLKESQKKEEELFSFFCCNFCVSVREEDSVDVGETTEERSEQLLLVGLRESAVQQQQQRANFSNKKEKRKGQIGQNKKEVSFFSLLFVYSR